MPGLPYHGGLCLLKLGAKVNPSQDATCQYFVIAMSNVGNTHILPVQSHLIHPHTHWGEMSPALSDFCCSTEAKTCFAIIPCKSLATDIESAPFSACRKDVGRELVRETFLLFLSSFETEFLCVTVLAVLEFTL